MGMVGGGEGEASACCECDWVWWCCVWGEDIRDVGIGGGAGVGTSWVSDWIFSADVQRDRGGRWGDARRARGIRRVCRPEGCWAELAFPQRERFLFSALRA